MFTFKYAQVHMKRMDNCQGRETGIYAGYRGKQHMADKVTPKLNLNPHKSVTNLL
jgi:hypothetical protein